MAWWLIFGLLGLFLGSWLNTWIWRWFTLTSTRRPSRCSECHQQLPWRDQLPLLSFWFLNGRCRFCNKKISGYYLISEIGTAIILAGLVWRFPPPADFTTMFLWLSILWTATILILVFIADTRFKTIFDQFLLPGIALVIVLRLLGGVSWVTILSGGLLGAVFFGSQYYLFRKHGFGFGDVKLGLFLGLAFAPATFLWLVAIAYMAGAVGGLWCWLKKIHGWRGTMPLGAFLSASGLLILLFGYSWIERLFGLS